MKKFIVPVKTNWKNVKYILIILFFCAVAFTPICHTFLSKKIDREYTKTPITLVEGLNEFDGVEFYISNGRILEAKKIESTVINKVFGWSNWRRFLLGGSPYFCLVALTFFCFWVFKRSEEQKDKYFRRTVSIVLVFFGFISVWFTIYSLVPKNDFSYTSYYLLLGVGSVLINVGFLSAYKWKKIRNYSADAMKSKIRLLTRFISVDIFEKYIKKSDEKEFLIDTLENYEKLNNN